MILTCAARSLSSTIFLRRTCATTLRGLEFKAHMSVQQPAWNLPENQAAEPVLKIYNSLTRSKVSCQLLSLGLSDSHSKVDRICTQERAPCQVV